MYALGPAHLDSEKQLLTIGGRAVPLQRKPFLVLLYLVENRHRMIYRKELLDRFWDGKEVYDQSLSKAIGNIRKAFGEVGTSSEFIETRWGLGYRYVGPFGESLPLTCSNVSVPAHESPESEDRSLSSQADETMIPASVLAHTGTRPETPTHPVPGVLPPETAPRQNALAWLLGASVVVILACAAVAVRFHDSAPIKTVAAAPVSIHSVAVLPFASNSENEEDKYLGLGLADAVSARLSTVSQLSVRSSSTVRSILGAGLGLHPDPASTSKKLEVEALVEGELRREQNKIIITVRLLKSSPRANLWSATFKADNNNIFATEDSIAKQVSSALLPQLGMEAVKRASGPETNNQNAYNKFMKAKFFANMRTQNSLAKAIDLLNEAILIDPEYARAYAALGDCYQLQGFYHFASPSDAYPRAKTAVRKALSLDNSIAEAHASLLSIYADYDWDWPGVEREFKAVVAIDPNYAVAYQYYGYGLLGMGRGEDALVAMKHAADLDPVSPSVQVSLAWAYYLLRHDELAVDQCKRALEMYPDFVPAHQLLGIVYGQMGASQRALAELNQAETLERDDSITPILLDYELARTGKQAQAARNLKDVLARSQGASIPDYYLAAAWTAIGDKQEALFFLDRAYRFRSNWVSYLQYDPRFDELRPEPQFKALLNKIAFPPNDSLAMQR
jgi:TolB-like protein/DNA-binding winged helix-turn-helix (wHTH) protein/Tfp pilus assembly protein PilF